MQHCIASLELKPSMAKKASPEMTVVPNRREILVWCLYLGTFNHNWFLEAIVAWRYLKIFPSISDCPFNVPFQLCTRFLLGLRQRLCVRDMQRAADIQEQKFSLLSVDMGMMLCLKQW